MHYWHAYAGAIDTTGKFVTWEAVKDKNGYRKITDDPSNIQQAFSQFLTQFDLTIAQPDNYLFFHKVRVWGIDGLTEISGAETDGNTYGDTLSREALDALEHDADFRDFMRLVPEEVTGGGGGGDSGEPPSVPQNFRIDSFGDDTVSLGWDEPVDLGSDPDTLEYVVEYKEDVMGFLDGGYTEFGTVTDTSIDVTPLGTETAYIFRVAARTSVGQSDYTTTVNITTLALFPSVNNLVLLEVVDPNTGFHTTFEGTPDGSQTPAEDDGDLISVWGYNGGAIVQSDEAKRPVLKTGIINHTATFDAVEFEGGTNFPGNYIIDPGGDIRPGWECLIVKRRFAPQPPIDRQTSGFWRITGEAVPPTTDSTDVHYKEDNDVIYERFGSDVRRPVFPVPIDITEWHIYQVRAREGEYKVWLNGILAYSSSSNVLANAPIASEQILGVSYFWPDSVSFFNGHFQLAAALFFNPDETEDATYRDAVTSQLRAVFTEKYDIRTPTP